MSEEHLSGEVLNQAAGPPSGPGLPPETGTAEPAGLDADEAWEEDRPPARQSTDEVAGLPRTRAHGRAQGEPLGHLALLVAWPQARCRDCQPFCFPRGLRFIVARSAVSIFSMVATEGVCLPVSIRLSVSTRMPARRASSACDQPMCSRSRTISRASTARMAATAGRLPAASAGGSPAIRSNSASGRMTNRLPSNTTVCTFAALFIVKPISMTDTFHNYSAALDTELHPVVARPQAEVPG